MAAVITMKQVALSSGLSVPTVSQILNDKGGFRDETKRRVMAAASELGYRPNGFAKAVRTGRFGTVALLLSTERGRSTLPEPLLRGIHDALAAADLHLMTAILPDAKLTSEGFVPKILRQLSSDGLLVNYTDHIPPKMVDLIRRHGVPCVWINTKQDADCVHPDDAGAGRAATERLLALGHRRIAYADFSHRVGNADVHYSAADRRAGYEAAMAAAGLTPRLLLRTEHYPSDETRRLSREALTGPGRITAVVGYATGSVSTVASAADELGLRVPRDLSAVTFGDAQGLLGFGHAQTMIVPNAEVAAAGVEMLREKIADPSRTGACRTIPFTVAEGNTTAPPSPVQ